MEKTREFFSRYDKLARHLGMELLSVAPGAARARMTLKEEHLNGVRTAHGGAIFSLADFVFAAAANSRGSIAVAINVSISFLKAAFEGEVLTAEGREISLNPKIGTYTIDVKNEKGEAVAIFQGMVYRKKEKSRSSPEWQSLP